MVGSEVGVWRLKRLGIGISTWMTWRCFWTPGHPNIRRGSEHPWGPTLVDELVVVMFTLVVVMSEGPSPINPTLPTGCVAFIFMKY